MQNDSGYSGDVDVETVWQDLARSESGVLVDVRTRAEWNFVGTPDLGGLGKEPVFVEWQHFPDGRRNEQFVEALRAELGRRGADQAAPLYFICRSGGRSAAAAAAMTQAGYANCYNVAGGFEGPHDANRHRGTVEGWKARGLPWTQG